MCGVTRRCKVCLASAFESQSILNVFLHGCHGIQGARRFSMFELDRLREHAMKGAPYYFEGHYYKLTPMITHPDIHDPIDVHMLAREIGT